MRRKERLWANICKPSLSLKATGDRSQNCEGHRSEVCQLLVVVLTRIQINLANCVKTTVAVGVNQERDVDPVAGQKRQVRKQLPSRSDLTGKRLANRSQIRVKEIQERTCGQLRYAAAALRQGKSRLAKRTAVEALHKGKARVLDERPDQATGKVLLEVLGVGVQKTDDLAVQD